jgi:hypothetical protein
MPPVKAAAEVRRTELRVPETVGVVSTRMIAVPDEVVEMRPADCCWDPEMSKHGRLTKGETHGGGLVEVGDDAPVRVGEGVKVPAGEEGAPDLG